MRENTILTFHSLFIAQHLQQLSTKLVEDTKSKLSSSTGMIHFDIIQSFVSPDKENVTHFIKEYQNIFMVVFPQYYVVP